MHIPQPRVPTEEVWLPIRGFPGYSVSSSGLILNNHRRSLVTSRANQLGVQYVGLYKNGVQHNRSVARCVAEAFLPPPPPSFDTPIHLNGRREDCRASNLMWRPKWFAVKYHRQFSIPPPRSIYAIEELQTRMQFKDSLHAASCYGLLASDVFQAAWSFTYNKDPLVKVWPTRQQFRFLL